MPTIYTIGHSTRTIEDFIALLQAHQIKLLFDVRAFPMSRRLPHFNREAMQSSLQAGGIAYRWMPALGGRRKKLLPKEQSPNVALRVDAFRNYADYMLTPEFRAAIGEVIAPAEQQRVTIMCAEAVYFRCHRMIVSDWLVLHGHEVLHIQDAKTPRPHKPTAEARLVGDDVHYRGDILF